MNVFKKWTAFFLPACAGLCLQGCMEEDLSECGANIHFQYTKNIDGVDKFSSEVKKINLYVFDAEGLFLDEYFADEKLLKAGSTLHLNLPAATYNLVAWGNLCEDYQVPAFEKKKTTLKSAILSLKYNGKTVNNQPGPLFFGDLPQAAIIPAHRAKQRLTIDMMKDTKKIRVITKGLSPQDIAQNKYACRITSVNGEYKFDNSIAASERLSYIPRSSVDEQGRLVSDFVVMRELNNGSTKSRLTFVHLNPGRNDEKELFSASLTDILLSLSKSKNLDVEDYFEIEMTLDQADGQASISIKGWGTIETGNEME